MSTWTFSVIKLLLNNNIGDPNKKLRDDYNIFHFACALGHADIVKFFMENDIIDIYQLTDTGKSALYFACGSNLEVVKILLKDSNFDINQQLITGETALYYAFSNHKNDIVKYLLTNIPELVISDDWIPDRAKEVFENYRLKNRKF